MGKKIQELNESPVEEQNESPVEEQNEIWIKFTDVSPEVGVPIRVKFGNGTIVNGSACMTSLGYLVDTEGTDDDYKSGLVGWIKKDL